MSRSFAQRWNSCGAIVLPDGSWARRQSESADMSISSVQTTSAPYSPTRGFAEQLGRLRSGDCVRGGDIELADELSNVDQVWPPAARRNCNLMGQEPEDTPAIRGNVFLGMIKSARSIEPSCAARFRD